MSANQPRRLNSIVVTLGVALLLVVIASPGCVSSRLPSSLQSLVPSRGVTHEQTEPDVDFEMKENYTAKEPTSETDEFAAEPETIPEATTDEEHKKITGEEFTDEQFDLESHFN